MATLMIPKSHWDVRTPGLNDQVQRRVAVGSSEHAEPVTC